MDGKCFVCGQAASMQCYECSGFCCAQHGEPRYCMYCALKHDDPIPLTHALSALGTALNYHGDPVTKLVNDLYRGDRIVLERLLPSYPGLQSSDPRDVKKFLDEFDHWIDALRLRDTPFGRLLEDDKRQIEQGWLARSKTLDQLFALLNDDDRTTRFRVIYVLCGQPDDAVVKALTRVLGCDRNIWVREAALKALIRQHEYSCAELPVDVISKALLEGKLYYWANIRMPGKSLDYRRSLCDKIRLEKGKRAAPYSRLRLAIDLVLGGKLEDEWRLRDFLVSRGEETQWAKGLLASTSEAELLQCIRLEYIEDRLPLRWEMVRGSVFEEPWIKAGLPTSKEEEDRDWGRPRRTPYHHYVGPAYEMANYV